LSLSRVFYKDIVGATFLISSLQYCSYAVADDPSVDSSASTEFSINKNEFNLDLERSFEGNFSVRDSFQLTHAWNFSDKTKLKTKYSNTSSIEDEGLKDTFGFDFQHKLPTDRFTSTIKMGYWNVEDSNAQAEATVSLKKKFDNYSIASNLKLRRRKKSNGEVVNAIGGTTTIGVTPFKNFALQITHKFKDDISTESTIVSGGFSKMLFADKLNISIDASSENTIYFGLSTSH